MSGIGNTPRKLTVLSLEARKSFAFGLKFKNRDESPVDLNGATVRLVVKQPKRQGSTEIINTDATILSDSLGLTQFEIQAADLDHPEGEYPFAITLVSSLGYSTVILKGVIDLRDNADLDDSNIYASVNPSTNLAAYLENGGLIEVTVDKIDGLYVIVQALIDQFEITMQDLVDTAETSADTATAAALSAGASAVSAAASAQLAGTIALDEANAALQTAITDPSSPLGSSLRKFFGVGEVAYALNSTGEATQVPDDTKAYPITGLHVSVPPSVRPVWINWHVVWGVSGPLPSQGVLQTLLYETTAGGFPVLVERAFDFVLASQPTTITFCTQEASIRVGASDKIRTFSLYARVFRDDGDDSLTGYIRNAAGYDQSWLSAEVR